MHVVRALIAVLLLALAGPGAAQGVQPVPALSSQVVDTAGLLPSQARARIEAKLAALARDKGAQVAFLIVATTAPEDIASYANRVGNTWKIGRRGVGDGVLLIVARDDRAVRIEVAKTLEGAIPDLAAKMIIDDAITPAFQRGDFAAGLEAAADHIGARVRGEPLPAPSRKGTGPQGDFNPQDFAFFLLFAVPVVASVLRGIFGRRLGSLFTGAGVGAAVYLVSASVLIAVIAAVVGGLLSLLGLSSMGRHMGGRGRGWGGTRGWPMPPHTGGGGGSTGGWGGSGGGFRSGGGGDFGGGGASGRW